ncbi:cell surface protein, partial [Brachyspira hyodysenteriae]
KWDSNPYDVKAQAVLGITANSDVVSLYVEPSLGYQATYLGKMTKNGTVAWDHKVQHSLAWGAYAELYVRPVQDLEWYFEMDVNNGGTRQPSNIPVYFETTTGITW